MSKIYGYPYIHEIPTNIVQEIRNRANFIQIPRIAFTRFKSNAVLEGYSNGLMLSSNWTFEDMYGLGSLKPVGIFNNNEVLSISSDNSSKGKPSAGIDSVTVTTSGDNGMLRKATISWYCGSKDELDILQYYFMIPGVTCTLDWGWNYLSPIHRNNKTFFCDNIVDLFNVDQTSDIFKSINGDPDTNTDSYDFVNTKFQIPNNGNYSMFTGIISNFSFTQNNDGSYSCTTELISPGTAGLYKDITLVEENDNNNVSKTIQEFFTSDFRDLISVTTTNVFSKLRNYFFNLFRASSQLNPEDVKNLSTLLNLKRPSVAATDKDNAYIPLSKFLNLINYITKVEQNFEYTRIDRNELDVPFSEINVENFPVFERFSSHNPEMCIMYTKQDGPKLPLSGFEINRTDEHFEYYVNNNGTVQKERSIIQKYIPEQNFLDSVWINTNVIINSFETNTDLLAAINSVLESINKSISDWWVLKATLKADGNGYTVINVKETVLEDTTDQNTIEELTLFDYSQNRHSSYISATVQSDLPKDIANNVWAKSFGQVHLRYISFGKEVTLYDPISGHQFNGEEETSEVSTDDIRKLQELVLFLNTQTNYSQERNESTVRNLRYTDLKNTVQNAPAVADMKIDLRLTSVEYSNETIREQFDTFVENKNRNRNTNWNGVLKELSRSISSFRDSFVGLEKDNTQVSGTLSAYRLQNIVDFRLLMYDARKTQNTLFPNIGATLSLSMPGISGIDNGHKLRIHNLPERFNTPNTVFFITGQTHEISKGDWTVDFESSLSIV